MPAIYPAFEKPLSINESFDGVYLSRKFELLDDIATSLHLATLSERIDARTMALELWDEEQLPANCPPVRWYSAQEGLTTVQGLLTFLEKHPGQLLKSEDIMAELQHLVVLLEAAKSQNIMFHLLVDL